MRKKDGRIIYSPSDLIVFMESPFASWMDRYYLENLDEIEPDEPDAGQVLLREQGDEHERAFLARLEGSALDVCLVPDCADAPALTAQAIGAGRAVIYQACLAGGDFAGKADFLVRREGRSKLGDFYYEVWDTKLSRKAKPYFLVQLCCYAEMLSEIQGCLPGHVSVVLGDFSERRFRIDDCIYFYRRLKSRFMDAQSSFQPGNCPRPARAEGHFRWNSHAARIIVEGDYLCQVADIRQSQIKKLGGAGIETMRQLADSTREHVHRLDDGVFARLRRQAALQIASAGRDRPLYEPVEPDPLNPRRGLAALPPPSDLDVYFDMEGYPFIEGGLEYLFGACFDEGGRAGFIDWWAHDRQSEKRAFEMFVDWVCERFRRCPSMHVYHYASYETSALKRLMGRHGTREAEIDMLLRNHVFVDLYAVVKQSLLVGEPAYSIKNIEHLYRPRRAGEVSTAVDSVVYYQRWLEAPDGTDWHTSRLLASIRDYNKDDCLSTLQLAGWLRAVQAESGIAWIAPAEPSDRTLSETAPRSPAALLAEQMLSRGDPDERRLRELLAQLLEFHWREAKPVFWAMFDRAAMSENELVEDINCLGGLVRTGTPPEKRPRSTVYEYAFDPSQDTKFAAGDEFFFAHDLRVAGSIVSFDGDAGRLSIKLGTRAAEPPDRLSIIPKEHVSAQKIADSIFSQVLRFSEGGELSPALRDLLLRRRPAIQGRESGPILAPGQDIVAGTSAALRGLGGSCLCIQGPPGSGKTTLSASVILDLLRSGRKVGITSNSHKAIDNLMGKVVALAARQSLTINAAKVKGSRGDSGIDSPLVATLVSAAEAFADGQPLYDLVGGTAWTFSDAAAAGCLDYLFVDEAGQVALANVAGMARCTRNIVLVGDQMQLSQPVKGSHPGESGQSALEYLLAGHDTIPDDFGIFLPLTYRMHPHICRFISAAFYEGRLEPAPQTAERSLVLPEAGAGLITRQSGLLYLPVAHEGNTQGSEEEVAAIAGMVESLARCRLGEGDLERRPLSRDDILIVAPYNMQVRLLASALPGYRVGTVDKFQGQEAPVVIVSMCASEGSDTPRGIEFLFSKNRLNVAISRAQVLAIVVGSPGLAATAVSTVEQVRLVNLYCWIVEEGLAP